MYDFEYDIQEATVWTLVMQTRDVISQLSKRLLSKIGLTPEKYHVLLLCINCKEPVTIAELSRMLFRKPHSVSGLLNRMESEGLLYKERSSVQDDQGPMSIVVTDHGVELYKQGMQAMMASVARCVQCLRKDELDHLESGLRSLRNAILTEMNVEQRRMDLSIR